MATKTNKRKTLAQLHASIPRWMRQGDGYLQVGGEYLDCVLMAGSFASTGDGTSTSVRPTSRRHRGKPVYRPMTPKEKEANALKCSKEAWKACEDRGSDKADDE